MLQVRGFGALVNQIALLVKMSETIISVRCHLLRAIVQDLPLTIL